ncbi:Tad domain-containing protein [Novosphingobium sp.]|uniref:Tad domain-containing protein n=1 Tax=Novosphingobium sp. TaxID=1874826 RepID=UPI0031D05ECE
MIMMAGMMFVLACFVGCAIDAARFYVVNSRLQQACDAGALAGRRAMTDTTLNGILDAVATAQAQSFFKNNFSSGWFGTTGVTFTPSKTSDGQLSASAQVTVPTVIMRILGINSVSLTATCAARLDVPDTDVIFVLDTTGSMACLPGDDDNTCNNYAGSAGKVSYLRPLDGSASGNNSMAGYPGSTAYYVPEKSGSRISALRTAVLSFYDTLTAASSAQTHIRYGFVTYTSTVNAGRAVMDISPKYIVGGLGSPNTNWTYNARSISLSLLGIPLAYTYQPVSENLSVYATGLPTPDPTKIGVNSGWAGCLEERYTTPGVTSFNINALPYDLDPDLVPTSDIRTQWKPMWPDVFYLRNSSTSNWPYVSASYYNNPSTGTTSTLLDFADPNPNILNPSLVTSGYVTCGKPVSRLSTMTRAQVSAYVNAPDFKPIGGTYHDTGMIWGTRLISPTGIFANDTAPWPGRTAPNRVIVFLTDGAMAPDLRIYGMYGNEYYDRRVSGGDFSNLTNYHIQRFLAECSAAKARNINIWTVSIATTAPAPLVSCATSNSQALATTSGTGLSAAFTNIAKQVSSLRISQ